MQKKSSLLCAGNRPQTTRSDELDKKDKTYQAMEASSPSCLLLLPVGPEGEVISPYFSALSSACKVSLLFRETDVCLKNLNFYAISLNVFWNFLLLYKKQTQEAHIYPNFHLENLICL